MKKAKRILAGALAALILTMSLPLSALADEADVPVESPSFEVAFDVDTGQEEISEDPPADIEATPEPTPEPTPESTATPAPTAEPTAVPTATPGVTATPTAVPTSTPEPSAVPSASPVVTPTPTPTPSPQPVVNPVKLEHDVLDNVDKVCIYLFPVPNSSEITQEYSAEHKAIDIAASSGSPVYAAEDGTVSYVQIWDGSYDTTGMMSYGHMVEVRHADGNTTLHAGYSNYTLRIRYDAKLNSDESLVYGDNGNKNEVVLTWKRTNDTYDTLIDDAHIYTYATNITKTFSDGKEEQTMFDNVLFKAQNASDGYYVIAQLNEGEGIWYVTGHTDKEASATAMHPVEWNGKKGQIILKGVEDDQYIWTELETANGYTLLKNNIDVTITSVDDANRPCDIYSKDTLGVIQNDPRYNFPNNEDYKLANIPQKQLAHNYQTASATVDGNDVTMLDDEMDTGSTNAIAPLQVVNTRGFETPMTGENGTWALAIGGVLVFCLGTSAFIFFLVFKRRKEQEDK